MTPRQFWTRYILTMPANNPALSALRHHETPDAMAYLIDGPDFAKLRAIADALQAGSDRERDAGHKLWLVLNNASELDAP